MTSSESRRQLTARDLEILLALDRCPLTVAQLLKLSRTFPGQGFGSLRGAQDRLQKLREAGWVRSHRYAATGRGGSPEYYKTSLLGFRLLHGDDAPPPTKRHFSEVSPGNHHHTWSLSEFIVHTIVSAHRQGIGMASFYRENTLRLEIGEQVVLPDCAFELHTPSGRQFNFLVELDNGTERIRSEKDTDSWRRKIRLYNLLQDRTHPHRFRVLVVCTRSRDRVTTILKLAAEQASNRGRSLFYGAHLADYLQESDAVARTCFRDHRGQPVSLVPVLSASEKSSAV